MSAPPRVAVCIPSYRRPQGLASLLGALDALAFEGTPPELRIVVVDNDPAGSARAVCDAARGWLGHPLHYVQEKRRGVPAARNAAVAAALGSDWIAFVDDDETPEPRWLEELLRVQAQYDADVVAGPVAPRFCGEPPRWAREGGFFASEPRPEGAPLATAYTNNVLVRTARLAGLPSLFDERMTPNGEDTELFARLARGGARLVWAPGARVYERVAPERLRLAWLLRRAFHVGVAASRVARRAPPSGDAAPRAVAHGLWCLARGLLQAPLAAAGRTAEGVRGLWLVGFALGRFHGLLRPRLSR